MDYQAEYRRWLESAAELKEELSSMTDAEVEDAFYRNLAFGTGGLRGIIGAGTNRMNIFTVAKASQGLADYLNRHFDNPSVAIGYDSRIRSDVFAQTAASVFAANGIAVNLWPRLNPVPTVSFAVRHLAASAGVMVTASHNPGIYNGYKVYGPDGCQITSEAAAEILADIEKLDVFSDVRRIDFDDALAAGKVSLIDDSVLDAFISEVKKQSVLFGDEADTSATIVYTPLNGAGLVPVTRILRECGYTDISVVPEQELPDGNFPTCPYPNPEIPEAMRLGLEAAERLNADLLLATDPDCDRVAIAVRDGNGMKLLSGNETGILLLDYICSQRLRHGKMPEDPVAVKTIVTTDLAESIASHYGVEVRNVLTGFKYIGEQIGLLEAAGRAERYVFGFEESCGYLSGSYVRDKDGVNAAFLICEMFSFYKKQGISISEKLSEIYSSYGFCLNTLHSYEFPGSAGFTEMNRIMSEIRGIEDRFAGRSIILCNDYLKGIDGLPVSDVLKFILEGGCSVVIRPSGTEPKIKIYISANAESKESAEKTENEIRAFFEDRAGICAE